MEILKSFINCVANINLGNYYPLIVSLSSLIFSLTLLTLTIFVSKIKKSDKTLPLLFYIISYLLCAFKIFSDMIFKKTVDFIILCSSVFLCALSLCVFAFCIILSRDKNIINQPIAPFLHKSNIDDYIPFRNSERLFTNKMFEKPFDDEFKINYSQILFYTSKLKNKDLSPSEIELLDQIEYNVLRLSRIQVSDEERLEFSKQLSKLFKLNSKFA